MMRLDLYIDTVDEQVHTECWKVISKPSKQMGGSI